MILTSDWTLTVLTGKQASEIENYLSSTQHEDTISATVPGCVELDLFRAGKKPDPYFSQNPYLYRDLEDKYFLYQTEFEGSRTCDRIRFEGIDTIADIYFNGEKIGRTENMFLPYSFPVKVNGGKNILSVLIVPPVLEARKYPLPAYCQALPFNYESLYLRKSASMFGWDIMPRFVSGGIFKPVYLEKKPAVSLNDASLFTLKADEESAYLRLNWSFETEDTNLNGYTLNIHGACGDSVFDRECNGYFIYGEHSFTLKKPKLWFPKNYGEQLLYHITVTLKKDGEAVAEKAFDFGIRTVKLVRTSTTDNEGNGEFCFFVNGKKIFILGTNWVPLDAFPSRQEERLPRALKLLNDSGCNAVRVWGGGTYENDAFYDYCDRHGILVWQDFCMGCAIYPNDDLFAGKMREEATYIVRKLRNHPSIFMWAGDNECDVTIKWGKQPIDPNDNIITRKILADVIRTEDCTRPYLPSSPYVDEEAYRTGKPLSEEHLWGPRDYFKGDYYRTAPSHFASEIGYHGCPSVKSLEKFIAKGHLYPFLDENDIADEDWICHASGVVKGMKGPYAYRIPLMNRQVKTLFGDTVPENPDDFAKASQISQAEAMKFFIEHFRVAKWRRTGIIWWNLIDGWPQISDAVVDWYGTRKLAYFFIRRAQNPLLLAMDEPTKGKQDIIGINDTQFDVNIAFEVKDLAKDEALLSGKGVIPANGTAVFGKVNAFDDYHFLLLTMKTEDGKIIRSHFTTKTKEIDYHRYLADLKTAGMDEFEGF